MNKVKFCYYYLWYQVSTHFVSTLSVHVFGVLASVMFQAFPWSQL